MRIRLSGEDAARLHAPEVLEVDLDHITLREAYVIKAATGLRPVEMILGVGLLDPDAWASIVWLGLHRVGVEVPIRDIDLELGEDRTRTEDEEPPKDPSPTSPTPARSTATGSRSPRSGAGRPTKRTR